MPMFRYQVTDRSGKMLSGAMSASSEADVRRKLSSMGYSVSMIQGPPAPAFTPPAPPRARTRQVSVRTERTNASPAEMVMLLRQIQTMLHSGTNLYQALATISGQSRSPGMQRIATRLASRVQTGERMSQAMMEFPRAFPPHVVGVVASGEVGGFLPDVLGDIALDYEIEQRASVRWMRWTQNLLWINAIGTLLLVPAISNVPEMMRGLDAYLRAYLSDLMTYILPPMALLILLFLVGRAFMRRPDMRPVADAVALRVPVLGRAIRDRSLANFSRMLWRLQSSGVLPIQAWDTASMAANNSAVVRRLRSQLGSLQQGARLSQAMQATGLFQEDERRMLEVGEMSGQTPDVLHRIAVFYEDRALSSAGRVRACGMRIAVLANVLALVAVVFGDSMRIVNMLSIVERDFEPMIWLLSPTK